MLPLTSVNKLMFCTFITVNASVAACAVDAMTSLLLWRHEGAAALWFILWSCNFSQLFLYLVV